MAQRALPGLGLTGFWDLGYDGWKNEMDANLRMLSVLVNLKVINRVATLPTSPAPAQGDIYIVTSGPNANKVAVHDGGVWNYLTPFTGWRAWDSTLGGYIYFNGTAWTNDTTGLNLIVDFVVFTSSGTYSKPADLMYAEVEVVGGGGNGGAAPNTNQYGAGAGGGAGAYARKLIAAATLASSETVTVGAATGTSSFGSHITCTGGSNGSGTSITSGSVIVSPGAGGTAAGGDINSNGQTGAEAVVMVSSPLLIISGRGADSRLGEGGEGRLHIIPSTLTNGRAGAGFGSGGGGAARTSSGGTASAGAGAPGIVIVKQYRRA